MLAGLVIATLYGVVLRVAVESGASNGVLVPMSYGFIFAMPLAVGFLTVRPYPAPGWIYRLCMPWIPILVGTAIVASMGGEGAICILMGLPAMLPMASLGGLAAVLIRRRSPLPVAAFVLLPFVTGGIERGIPQPVQVREAVSVIDIAATPERVWRKIVEVPAIAPAELPDALYLRMGFPRPISATVDGAGVGSMRRATFTGNLVFHETVTAWQPPRLLSFRIAAQTDSIPPTTLDPHVTIGGAYFDVLQGTYALAPIPGGTRVTLTSRMRVSTHFNGYAGPWADAIMRSIQETILAVEKRRAESV
jgi:uncharacterized protein YndB with AHSA1/START domain